jgi:acetolactate synthase-1/2/3 large subunit
MDFPMDLQRSRTCEGHEHNKEISDSVDESFEDNADFVECLNNLLGSKKPLLYIGNGCRSTEAILRVKQLISKLELPYLVSWSAIDLFEDSDPLNVGRVGIYGDRHANLLLQDCDYLLTIGTRLAIPQVGYDRKDFARNAAKWIVEIDPAECIKHDETDAKVFNISAEEFLSRILELLDSSEKAEVRSAREDWLHLISTYKIQFPRDSEMQIGPRSPNYVHSTDFILFLNRVLRDDAMIVTDVGAGLLSGHYAYAHRGSQRFFTSQGLGEMGFGLPAAIGAHFANSKAQIVCLNTDGAMMFNLQELQTVSQHNIPLKLIVFNNDGYAMIRISQENLFENRLVGSTVDTGISFPNFKQVAETFGFEHVKVSDMSHLDEELKKHFDSSSRVLIEIMMDPTQKYLPRLGTRKNADGKLFSPALEDLDPAVDLSGLFPERRSNVVPKISSESNRA